MLEIWYIWYTLPWQNIETVPYHSMEAHSSLSSISVDVKSYTTKHLSLKTPTIDSCETPSSNSGVHIALLPAAVLLSTYQSLYVNIQWVVLHFLEPSNTAYMLQCLKENIYPMLDQSHLIWAPYKLKELQTVHAPSGIWGNTIKCDRCFFGLYPIEQVYDIFFSAKQPIWITLQFYPSIPTMICTIYALISWNHWPAIARLFHTALCFQSWIQYIFLSF